MKHIVLKYLTKKSENFKPYNVGDEIELNKDDAKRLIESGHVKVKQDGKNKKRSSGSN